MRTLKLSGGLRWEGSERFGFDDVYSRDHDFGPGFCMWITEDVYMKIGEKLQDEYSKFQKVIRALQELTPLWLKEEWAFV